MKAAFGELETNLKMQLKQHQHVFHGKCNSLNNISLLLQKRSLIIIITYASLVIQLEYGCKKTYEPFGFYWFCSVF